MILIPNTYVRGATAPQISVARGAHCCSRTPYDVGDQPCFWFFYEPSLESCPLLSGTPSRGSPNWSQNALQNCCICRKTTRRVADLFSGLGARTGFPRLVGELLAFVSVLKSYGSSDRCVSSVNRSLKLATDPPVRSAAIEIKWS